MIQLKTSLCRLWMIFTDIQDNLRVVNFVQDNAITWAGALLYCLYTMSTSGQISRLANGKGCQVHPDMFQRYLSYKAESELTTGRGWVCTAVHFLCSLCSSLFSQWFLTSWNSPSPWSLVDPHQCSVFKRIKILTCINLIVHFHCVVKWWCWPHIMQVALSGVMLILLLYVTGS